MTSSNTTATVGVDDVRAAAGRIRPFIHRTPLLPNRSISERVGFEVRIKCENLQGVALASRLLGVRATIVMPEGSVASKVEATKAYGAEVVTSGVTAATRDTVAREIADKTGASVVPPFDDERIIAGQGTVGLEIMEEWPQVETIVVPLGGGGLLSGVAVAAASLKSNVAVYGVEPRAGNDGEQSFKTGRIVTIDPPKTIADGARTLAIGTRNFAIIRERVRDVVSVDDVALLDAVKFAMYRTKMVIEPTGALGIAALLTRTIVPRGPVAVVVSGGNLDFSLLCK